MDINSWKSAFQATIKQTKLPFLFKIIGYLIVFVLSGQILKFLGYPEDFLINLILATMLIFLARFCFTLIQEKNKQ